MIPHISELGASLLGFITTHGLDNIDTTKPSPPSSNHSFLSANSSAIF